MILRSLLSVALWLGVCTASFAQGPTASPQENAWRVVFIGPLRPVVIEVQVSSDEGPASRRRKLAELLMTRFDTDKDSYLSATEAATLPQGGKVSGPPIGEAWKPFDQVPADERLSLDELTAFVNQQLGPSLRVTTRPPRLAQSVQLTDRIDGDGDKAISSVELQGAMAILRGTDLDDDEAVSVGELQPYPRRAGQQPPSQAVRASPLQSIDQDSDVEAAASLIVESFGQEQGSIPLTTFAEDSTVIDTDQDGRLSKAELANWLKAAPPAFTITASLGQKRPSSVTVQSPMSTGKPMPGREASVDLGGASVEVTALNNKFEQGDASRMYGIRFLMNDRDKNGYLDEMEFAGLQLPAAFGDVDVNGDKMLYRDELSTFVAFDAIAVQARIEMTIADEGKTLFELLDANVDRRLTPREVQEGYTRLSAVDRNQDQRVAQSELESRFRLTFSYGRNQIFAPNAPGMNTPVTARLRNQNQGPSWYQRMDRNQDGDITWREFLGTREQFDMIDKNSDQLINRMEADEAASSTSPMESTNNAR
jgi:Ca2+-binding EF-hand superfamily protein